MTIGKPYVKAGTSEIGASDFAFREDEIGGTIVRFMHEPDGEKVTWKDEGEGGPVWVDGVPIAEVKDPDGSWYPAWYSRGAARKIAKGWGMQFEEV